MLSGLRRAGADGIIQRWDVKDGTLSEGRRGAPIAIESPYGASDKAPVFRALACSPHDEDFVLGSSNCDIWEANDAKQVRMIARHAAAPPVAR